VLVRALLVSSVLSTRCWMLCVLADLQYSALVGVWMVEHSV
jgi:hypothetical protein